AFPKIEAVITPDPPVRGQKEIFTVFGTVPATINQDNEVYLRFFSEGDVIASFHIPACGPNSLQQCPINNGSFFIVPFSVQVPDYLPNPYDMMVQVGDPDHIPL
ncbi:4113_t:CDS:1, partial [Paraglomus occultum]